MRRLSVDALVLGSTDDALDYLAAARRPPSARVLIKYGRYLVAVFLGFGLQAPFQGHHLHQSEQKY